jgi:hypothetical protein
MLPAESADDGKPGRNKARDGLWLALAVVACVISFFAGKYHSLLPPGTEQELDNFLTQVKPLLADHDARTKEQVELLIEVLKALDARDDAKAKQEVIARLGGFYYNYTYEDERHMNTESTELLLKKLENLSASSESFAQVVKFKPAE